MLNLCQQAVSERVIIERESLDTSRRHHAHLSRKERESRLGGGMEAIKMVKKNKLKILQR